MLIEPDTAQNAIIASHTLPDPSRPPLTRNCGTCGQQWSKQMFRLNSLLLPGLFFQNQSQLTAPQSGVSSPAFVGSPLAHSAHMTKKSASPLAHSTHMAKKSASPIAHSAQQVVHLLQERLPGSPHWQLPPLHLQLACLRSEIRICRR